MYVIIALVSLLLCTTISTGVYKYKYDKLVSENGAMLELARERADVLTDTLTRAREEVGAIGESLSRQRNSVAELRDLLTEVRTRYEKMENLLDSAGYDYSDIYGSDSCIDSSNGR